MDAPKTPNRKLVHWAFELSDSPFGSPASSSAPDTTSSIQFLNSQLIAHGFIHSPGLNVDAMAVVQQDALVKCLMNMLQQRMDDMARAEDLSTDLRKLGYDHERVLGMYKDAKERAAQAERNEEAAKSKLAAITKLLAASEAAHKHTTANLIRTQSQLQTIRAHGQAEIKRKEKEMEKMAERWNRVASEQAKLSVAGAGMRASGSLSGGSVSKADPILERAVAELEQTRQRLVEENDAFRSVLVSLANTIQHMLPADEAPPPILPPNLFTPSLSQMGTSPDWQAQNAHAKLRELCSAVKERLDGMATPASAPVSPVLPSPKVSDEEVERLKDAVRRLERELEESKAIAARGQKVVEEFMQNEHVRKTVKDTRSIGDLSLADLTPLNGETRTDALDRRTAELEEERRKFTEAAIRLGKERAEVQAERIQFEEQKRKFALQQMLADLPATPAGSSTAPSPSGSSKRRKKEKGPSLVKSKKHKTPSPVHRSRPLFPRPQGPLAFRPAVPSPLSKMMTMSMSSHEESEEEVVQPGRLADELRASGEKVPEADKENVRVRKSPLAHVVGRSRRPAAGGSRAWKG